MRRTLGWALGALVALGACAGEEDTPDARSSQIEFFLARSMLPLARSRPRQLSLRLDEMATSPFRFLRGSEALFTRDMRDATLPFASTSMPGERVLLQGDAHPENVGTFRGPRVEWNDFDAAGFGPPWWEVRRAGASLLVALREAKAPREQETEVVSRLARAYAGEILAGRVEAVGGSDVGKVIEGRVESAAEDGAARQELADFTELREGQRRLRRGLTDPDDPREALLAAPQAITDALPRTLDDYRRTLLAGSFGGTYFGVKDAARRCGQGVGSLTAVRFYVLIEGPTASADDDVILQIKEATDASLDADLATGSPAVSHAARVVERQRRLQSVPDADPHLGHARLLDLPVVVSTVTDLQKTVRVGDLEKRAAEPEALLRFAEDAGRLLGRMHARGVTLDNERALPALQRWLAGREEMFVSETIGAARAYADQVEADHARFLALRTRLGAALGLPSVTTSDTPVADPARAILDPPCP